MSSRRKGFQKKEMVFREAFFWDTYYYSRSLWNGLCVS